MTKVPEVQTSGQIKGITDPGIMIPTAREFPKESESPTVAIIPSVLDLNLWRLICTTSELVETWTRAGGSLFSISDLPFSLGIQILVGTLCTLPTDGGAH